MLTVVYCVIVEYKSSELHTDLIASNFNPLCIIFWRINTAKTKQIKAKKDTIVDDRGKTL